MSLEVGRQEVSIRTRDQSMHNVSRCSPVCFAQDELIFLRQALGATNNAIAYNGTLLLRNVFMRFTFSLNWAEDLLVGMLLVGNAIFASMRPHGTRLGRSGWLF